MHRLDGHASGHIGHVDLAGLGSLIEVPVAQALLPVPKLISAAMRHRQECPSYSFRAHSHHRWCTSSRILLL
jgi:hypothetical protein